MSAIQVKINVQNWQRDGRHIFKGAVPIATFEHELDARLFEAVLASYLANTDKNGQPLGPTAEAPLVPPLDRPAAERQD